MEKMVPQIHSFEEIEIGKSFEFEHCITTANIDSFAELIGDFNPLHVDHDFAKKSPYKGRISHGMLAASLFSTLLGMYCPGRDNIILSLSVRFKKPVCPDAKLVVKGEILNKVNSLKVLTVKTAILDGEDVLIEGEAKVKML